jgi:hypothetical protein
MKNYERRIDPFDYPESDEVTPPSMPVQKRGSEWSTIPDEIMDYLDQDDPDPDIGPEIEIPDYHEEIEKFHRRHIVELNLDSVPDDVPGDYDLPSGRGELIGKTCSSCAGEIEKTFFKVSDSGPHAVIGPDNKGYWKQGLCRCSKCRLVYDY